MINHRIRQRATSSRPWFAGALPSGVWTQAAVLLAVLAASAAPTTAQERPATAKEQLEFGVEMAQRDLWSEALFRFRQAERLDPENPRVFNNLAVAHEALGMFEEALDLYRQGLELAPQDKALRNNYARFVDFYQRFKPDEPKGENDEDAAEEAPATDDQPPTVDDAAAPR